MAGDSLFIGVSGLEAQQTNIDVISNNIANVNTTAFKGQRVTFQDLLYQTTSFPTAPSGTRGGVNATQDGLGVKVATTDSNFSQGGLETTGINTDLSINGDGFFVLGDTTPNSTTATNPVYTRDGAFSLNQSGLLYDPASGKAVLGFNANSAGVVTPSSNPGTITIPLGLKSQAVGTGFGAKAGPTGDQVFDAQFAGNLDLSQYLSAANAAVGNGGTSSPISISTTVYDSLGDPHLMTLVYSADAAGATPATQVTAGAGGTIAGAVTLNKATTTNDVITITSNGPAAGTYAITDTLGNNITAAAGQQVTVGGATFTTTTPAPAAASTNTITITGGTSGLPATVQDASGNKRAAASRWQVSASFTDGTTFSTISTAGTVNGAGVATGPTFGQNSSGTLGFAYFDQNGQFINASGIEGVAAGQSILQANAAAFLHTAAGSTSINQGNQINIQSWGPGAATNNSTAPTAGGAAPKTGPIALDFSGDTALSGASTATTLSQNGFTLGTLQNITIAQDGTITGAFSNGQSQTLAQVALATFQNEQGLLRQGNSQYVQSANSGLPQVGTANTGRFGAIISGSLEESNVSLADEFAKMIAAQRAFQANSASITTADQDLQTVIGLKR